MRSRVQRILPMLRLIEEAEWHLRRGREGMPAWVDGTRQFMRLRRSLKTAHEHSLHPPVKTALTNNLEVDLGEVYEWIQSRLRELNPWVITPTTSTKGRRRIGVAMQQAMTDAFEAYACASNVAITTLEVRRIIPAELVVEAQ